MKQEIFIGRNSAILNFSTKYCDTSENLLSSAAFKKVLSKYINSISNKNTSVFQFLKSNCKEDICETMVKLFKLLIVLDKDEIKKLDPNLSPLLSKESVVFEFIEGLYSYWRRFERYAIIRNKNTSLGLQNINFIDSMNSFTNLILKTYRLVEENVLGEHHRVYRQLHAGVNAGLILNNITWRCPKEYSFLEKIPFVESIVLQPPFITYPRKNTRKGVFYENKENPIENLTLNLDSWVCYPAKVGELLAFVYFDINFMAQGVTLCNLFELAKKEEYVDKKPDIIYMYGVKDFHPEMRTEFFKDAHNDIMVGYVNFNEGIDYFGYMKKMILTLHNLKMIDNGYLPIHGAMVNLTFKNGLEKNVIIMGDSGAGKSESLEAFRKLSEDYIKDMKVIFDDMGVLKLDNNSLSASGTEIGAFIRLDDLDIGYPYKEIDRSIFMNPDKINSRIIIPISTHADIIKKYPIDIFLYANNYEEGEELEFFETASQAKPVFIQGARNAKGTTSEIGLVTSYFANPFGPLQRKNETDTLIENYFEKMFQDNILVGQIRTCLGIEGFEKIGPEKAAKKLFELIIK
ncbi:phosphoenolpyruvate carboxykinase [Cetobacterium sp.]|uniref:phosphoenolpyruvate carboxykinase n=1 Tax=Cetobacterium sp. TaxID=2071632 RepID=UPI003AEF577C